MLYMVGTPIGNIQDLTPRAKQTIALADYIYAEDTRVARQLINLADITIQSHLKIYSCNSHNELQRSAEIIKLLTNNPDLNIIYLSDAGTPGLNDPGGVLIHELTEANLGQYISPIVGVSALNAIISISGFNLSKGFYFGGFLPRKKSKLKQLLENYPIIFAYESPHRITQSLELLQEYITAPNKIIIGRELTKKFEEIIYTSAQDIANITVKEKGEFCIGIWQLT